MKTKQLTRTIVLFAALTIAGVLLIVFPQGAEQSELGTVLPLVGSALFSAGLTFFLVEVSRLTQS